MQDNPRIEELRRRVQADPASIAFAQLAEEYRRGGSYVEAVTTCRAGLDIHPGYLSARITLGRALIEVGDLEAAESELSLVLQSAPENLAAIRGLAEIHHRRGNLGEALVFYRAALGLARHDPDLEQAVDDISRTLTPERSPFSDGLTFEQATEEFLSALSELPGMGGGDDADAAPNPEAVAVGGGSDTGAGADADSTELPELERFLDAIHTYRQRRAV